MFSTNFTKLTFFKKMRKNANVGSVFGGQNDLKSTRNYKNSQKITKKTHYGFRCAPRCEKFSTIGEKVPKLFGFGAQGGDGWWALGGAGDGATAEL